MAGYLINHEGGVSFIDEKGKIEIAKNEHELKVIEKSIKLGVAGVAIKEKRDPLAVLRDLDLTNQSRRTAEYLTKHRDIIRELGLVK